MALYGSVNFVRLVHREILDKKICNHMGSSILFGQYIGKFLIKRYATIWVRRFCSVNTVGNSCQKNMVPYGFVNFVRLVQWEILVKKIWCHMGQSILFGQYSGKFLLKKYATIWVRQFCSVSTVENSC